MPAEAGDADSSPVGGGDQSRLVGAGRQMGDHVEPGGDPLDPRLREMLGERGHDRVATIPVAAAHAAQVAVELTAGDQLRQRHLIEGRRLAGERLALDDRGEQLVGEEQPADAQGGRQRLAGAASVDDALGRQALEGTAGPRS